MSGKAAAAIELFSEPMTDSGHAGLALACWELTKEG